MESRRVSVGCESYALTMTRRGITRTLVGVAIGAAFALTALFGVAVPTAASAGTLKCEYRFLDADDDMSLRAAALKVLPKSVHIAVAGACRNPDWAYGFIETRKNVTAEGVRQWWESLCRRDARMWKCEPPEFKQTFAMSVNVAGVSHLVELSFGKESSLERARAFASRAIEAYLDPTSLLPSCGIGDPKESDRLRAQSSLSPLPSGEDAIHVSVSNDAKASVDLDDVEVRIDFRPSADAAGSEAVCWWQLVVVT
jgi:hypothetical protein